MTVQMPLKRVEGPSIAYDEVRVCPICGKEIPAGRYTCRTQPLGVENGL